MVLIHNIYTNISEQSKFLIIKGLHITTPKDCISKMFLLQLELHTILVSILTLLDSDFKHYSPS